MPCAPGCRRSAFIAPDLNHDTHIASVPVGDQYLSQLIPAITASHDYRDGSTVIFLVWDEGEGGTATDCATNTTDIGCHVAAMVISPSTPAHKGPARGVRSRDRGVGAASNVR
jgi:hypothetical protein